MAARITPADLARRATPKPDPVIKHQAIEVRAINITPDVAAHWLEMANTHNRPLKAHTVTKYTREMTEGRWRPLIGEPISFSENGTILNGQHRLWAIVKSGRAQMMLVLGGLEMNTQDAMDAGAVRVAGQQLALHGWKNATGASATSRLLLQWRGGGLFSDVYRPSTAEVVTFAEQHRDALAAATATGIRVRKTTPILVPVTSAVAFTAYEMALENPHRFTLEKTAEFFTALETGANLPTHHPILTLRATATRRAANKVRTSAARELFNVVRAWNAWRTGETLEKLQAPKGGVITDDHLVMI